jgi:S1-C subfamily serine protease
VIEDAKSIWIQGVNGDFNTKHTASVVATDKFNDLALLKIEGVTVNTSGIPYSVKTSTSEVGEDVFVLGYPLTSTMGEEIKLTTGVVSSKTGFQGDVSLYQISAPIQPGNSGGPLFDGNGNVIGIVSAKHKGAENVGYAIKASYLRNLMESALSENILPQSNKIASYKLSDKVKSLKNYVYYITCSSSSNSQSATISSNNTNHSSSPSAKAYPSIRTTGGTLAVTGVEIKANETVLSLASTNNLSGGWMNISKGAHIIANGIKYTLVRVEGITYEPEYTYFAYQGETKHFKLYFQAIPQGTQTIDFIESSSSAWKIYGIPVK